MSLKNVTAAQAATFVDYVAKNQPQIGSEEDSNTVYEALDAAGAIAVFRQSAMLAAADLMLDPSPGVRAEATEVILGSTFVTAFNLGREFQDWLDSATLRQQERTVAKLLALDDATLATESRKVATSLRTIGMGKAADEIDAATDKLESLKPGKPATVVN